MVEAIRFACAHCGAMMHAWPYEVGDALECEECEEETEVPAVAPAPEPAAKAPAKPAAAAPAPAKTPGSKPGVAGKPPPQVPPAGFKPVVSKASAPGAKIIRFKCPHCKAIVQAEVSHAGLMMLCPQCKQNLPVPEAPAS
jgi:DNA-directed RNA polymerase subunit M/transcription elongation factor TFIIS